MVSLYVRGMDQIVFAVLVVKVLDLLILVVVVFAGRLVLWMMMM